MSDTKAPASDSMQPVFAAGLCGAVFALGLALSGMTQPSKVIGFLDFAGEWDPSLALVMVGALLVYGIGWRLVRKAKAPVLATTFSVPPKRAIDGRLLLGAALFGCGWGLGGYCPGPALVSLGTFSASAVIFTGSMAIGMVLYSIGNQVLSKSARQAKGANS